MNIAMAIPEFSTNPRSLEGSKIRKVLKQCASKVGKCELRPRAAVFRIDTAFNPRASNRDNAEALDSLMTCLTDLDSIFINSRVNVPSLYDSGVFYYRTVIWDTIPALYKKGFGDCKSLAAARVAELRKSGVRCRPVFRFVTRPDLTLFHILVMYENGQWEDPSKILGMQAPQEHELTG